jgi:hypothetical protein
MSDPLAARVALFKTAAVGEAIAIPGNADLQSR